MDQYETPVVSSEDADQNVTIRRRRMLTLDPLDENEDGQEDTTTGIEVPANQDEPEEDWDNISVRSARSNRSENTSKSSSSGSRASECWADNPHIYEGNSAAAQRGLVGATGSSGNHADILVASKTRVFSGVPVSPLLTKLSKKQNGKGENSNIAAIVADLDKERPDIMNYSHYRCYYRIWIPSSRQTADRVRYALQSY